MSSSVNLKAAGLTTQPNQLETPEGGLTEASNVIIQRDDVIEPRRGFGLFGNSFGTLTDRLQQLFVYKFRLMRYWGDSTLEYDTGTVDNSGEELFLPFSGTFTEAQEGLRTKSVESNGNFYFTSGDGIQKISASSTDQFTTDPGFIVPAGGIKALGMTADVIIEQGNITGFLPQDSTVAYRTVWGYNDNNKNLILGVPSPRVEVYNYLSDLLVVDVNNTLQQIQNVANQPAPNASIINDPDYVSSLSLLSGADPTIILNTLIALASKLDNNIQLANDAGSLPLTISGIDIANSALLTNNVATITFSAGDPTLYWSAGSNIYLTGFPVGENGTDYNGVQTISAISPTTISFLTDATGNSDIFNATNVAIQTTGYTFTVTAANATAGATYTNNGQTFTVTSTITGASTLVTTGTGAPLSSGILTKASGTGDATITFSSVTPSVNYATFTISGHGFKNFDPIKLSNSGGALPSPLVAGTVYYVGSVTTDTFQLYATSALGTPINITNAGSGTNTITYFMPITGTNIHSGEFESIVQPTAPDTPATDDELVAQQTYLRNIIQKLQAFPSTGTPPIISAYSQTNYISTLTVTTSANVRITVSIPPGVTTSDFFQVYRSPVLQATGTTALQDLTPSDELQLAYEAFPTAADIAAGYITFIDITPDQFLGAFLYTNEASGVGIANANETPPFALDINRFKNVTFYANTHTKYRMSLNLLGVSQMIAEYEGGTIPTLVISDGVTTNTYSFVLGVQQQTQVIPVADVADSLNGKYWEINSGNDIRQYYIWYKTSGGTTSDPMVAGRTGVEVFINTGDSISAVASKTQDAINTLLVEDFICTISGTTLTITNNAEGYTTDADAGTSGFAVTTPVSGVGQKQSTLQVLLSNLASPAEAVNETALSLIDIINHNPLETISAFYLSQSSTVPGQITLESRTLATPQYYLLANNSITGASFNPDLSPAIEIQSISPGDPSTNFVTTVTPHGLMTGDQVVISGTTTTPSANGLWTVLYLTPTEFRINETITSGATGGEMIAADDAQAGDNETKVNRIYFSRFQQPEAVPLGNTIDVGDADKPILRILPLRDTLFVFKEEALYRISGETAPFSLQLFDTSCLLVAPDSLSVAKNVIYGWTTQGILSITEAGVSNPPISRPIDVNILPISNQTYPSFSTSTWGLGYDSDNSYIVYTVTDPSDTEATIAYRYSTLTSTWTTFDKSNTCGIINIADDKLYLGAGDINFIEQERKNFNRFDYADREIDSVLDNGFYFGSTLQLPDVSQITIGDVLIQNQNITVYGFNSLLQKLDIDSSLQTNAISAMTIGLTPIITTIGNHYLSSNDYINLTGTATTPLIDGVYKVTVLNATQFQITVASPVLTAAIAGKIKYSYYNTLKVSGGVSFEAAQTTLSARLNIEPSLIYKSNTSSIVSNSVGNPTILTLAAPHTMGGAGTTRIVLISGHPLMSPTLNGVQTITVIDSTHVSIPLNASVSNTGGTLQTIDDYVNAITTKSGTITNISVANPTIITDVNHEMVSNRYIQIASSNSTPTINGNYTATVLNNSSFSIPVSVLIAGNHAFFTTLDGTPQDELVNYNYIIDLLNEDPGTSFNNYMPVTSTTSQEAIIIAVNKATKQITTEIALDYVVGPLNIFKAINSTFTYAPVTFKDPLNLKQVSEATLMFENKAFSSAFLSFKSDLIPSFLDIPFRGTGNGSFGLGIGKFGGNFFGGASNAAPFRTLIPRDAQRCRYIIPKFTHTVAFEKYIINGLTLSGNIGQSTRAYR